MHRRPFIAIWATLILLMLANVHTQGADQLVIAENGEPNAQIVIAETPPRIVSLAAQELQHYIHAISGAELPIVHQPEEDLPNRIYLGSSHHTDELGINTEGLRHGAFRMVSGDNWLALVGDDYDFVPPPSAPVKHSDRPRADADWDSLTGSTWQHPMHTLYKDYNRDSGLWRFDQGGSLNAVYALLRSLGVRWYLPGELGEVVPRQPTIALPAVDKTVRPSFALRCLKWGNYNAIDWKDLIWDRRLGVNSGYQVWGAASNRSHGMRNIISRAEMQATHPEYYALLGTTRDTTKNDTGTPCLRSPGLIRETIAYCRAVYDHFDEPMVSIWPTDGFKRCQCELCQDVTNDSDYVWEFVDRVAAALYASHPDRYVSCGAYASYVEPPTTITRFSPNVVVIIANRGRPWFGASEHWQTYWGIVQGWQKLVAEGNIIRGENNLYSVRMGGRRGPVAFAPLHPREFAKDLQALAGICMGERNEVPRGYQRLGNTYTWRASGIDHLNLYINARFLWDVNQDIETVLEEYYRLFYGPAAEAMQDAFGYADARFPSEQLIPAWEERAELVRRLQAARQVAGDSIYGERIDLILNELPSLDVLEKADELANQRGQAITYDRLMDMSNDKTRDVRETFQADGKLDEPFWQWYPHGRNLSPVGDQPSLGSTTFMARWHQNSLYLGIHCEDPNPADLTLTANGPDDPAMLTGDRLEVLIETSPDSFYRLVIDPAGRLLDEDLSANGIGRAWSSQAYVAAHVGPDSWSVELRLPIVSPAAAAMDPNFDLAGRAPTLSWPWFFNIGRFQLHDGQSHAMTWSPLGDRSFTNPATLGRLMLRGDAVRLKPRN